MTLGEKIKQVRTDKKMTQKELGTLCGMADSAIRKYESGRQNPKLTTVLKIAKALQISPGELLPVSEGMALADAEQVESFRQSGLAPEEFDTFIKFLNHMGYEVQPKDDRSGYYISDQIEQIFLSLEDFRALMRISKASISGIIHAEFDRNKK